MTCILTAVEAEPNGLVGGEVLPGVDAEGVELLPHQLQGHTPAVNVADHPTFSNKRRNVKIRVGPNIRYPARKCRIIRHFQQGMLNNPASKREKPDPIPTQP